MNKRYLYGLTGFLSLLGLIGLFTEDKTFLAFFAFAVDFEYFFIKSDEMLEDYINRSAARAFFLGMTATSGAAMFNFLIGGDGPREALLGGFSFGWAVSVLVYTLSSVYFGFREKWGLDYDK